MIIPWALRIFPTFLINLKRKMKQIRKYVKTNVHLFYGPYILKYQKYILKLKIYNYILKYEKWNKCETIWKQLQISIRLFYEPYIFSIFSTLIRATTPLYKSTYIKNTNHILRALTLPLVLSYTGDKLIQICTGKKKPSRKKNEILRKPIEIIDKPLPTFRRSPLSANF